MSVFTYFIFYFCHQCVGCHVVVIETLYKSDFTHYKFHKVIKCQKDDCLPSRNPLGYSNFVPKMQRFFRIFHVKNIMNLKFGSEVTQGHLNWHRSICHLSLPPWTYLAPFLR